MADPADIVIVGGGVVGSSVAYHLLADGFRGRVVVCERDGSYARASTPLSMGGIRQQFGAPINIQMARYGVGFFEAFDEAMAVRGEPARSGLRQRGYLFLADEAKWPLFARRLPVQRALGVEVEVLEPEDVAKLVPELDPAGIARATYCARDGYVDPWGVLWGFRRKAQALGAEYLEEEVVGIDVVGGRVAGVRARPGGRIACPVVVNAAGADARAVGALAGVEVPVDPLPRQVYVARLPRPVESGFPMVVDPTGVHFRSETSEQVFIAKPRKDEAPGVRFGWDRDYFVEEVWPVLARRVPMFDALRLERGWGGLYEMTPDGNGLVGPHPDLPGFYLATGFSGHGLMMSPATGKLVSEAIRLGRYETLDATCLAVGRYAAGRPVVEDDVF